MISSIKSEAKEIEQAWKGRRSHKSYQKYGSDTFFGNKVVVKTVLNG